MRALLLTGVVAAAGVSVSLFSSVALAKQEVSFGWGTAKGIDSRFRRTFERSNGVSVSVARQLSRKHAWIVAEIGYDRAEGDVFDDDPTFEIDRPSLTRLPLAVGVRIGNAEGGGGTDILFQADYGAQITPMWWNPPLSDSKQVTILGLYGGFRTSVPIAGNYRAWIRPRVSALFDAEFERGPTISPSVFGLDLGLSYMFSSRLKTPE